MSLAGSGGHAECLLDKFGLSGHVRFRQPSDLPFSNDVHRFVSRDGIYSALEGSKSLARGDALFEETVISEIICEWPGTICE